MIEKILHDSDFNIRRKFYEESKQNAIKEHEDNELHRFCRDVEYYMKRGMSKTTARRYVKWWYKQHSTELKGGNDTK